MSALQVVSPVDTGGRLQQVAGHMWLASNRKRKRQSANTNHESSSSMKQSNPRQLQLIAKASKSKHNLNNDNNNNNHNKRTRRRRRSNCRRRKRSCSRSYLRVGSMSAATLNATSTRGRTLAMLLVAAVFASTIATSVLASQTPTSLLQGSGKFLSFHSLESSKELVVVVAV